MNITGPLSGWLPGWEVLKPVNSKDKGDGFMKDRCDTGYQVGQDNLKKWGMVVHPAFFCCGFPGLR